MTEVKLQASKFPHAMHASGDVGDVGDVGGVPFTPAAHGGDHRRVGGARGAGYDQTSK